MGSETNDGQVDAKSLHLMLAPETTDKDLSCGLCS
jgi:hypothetical protein